MKNKIIAVDFDGTLCENKWPEIGEANESLIQYLKKRQEEGDKLILWTNRVDDKLDAAVAWSAEHGIIFDAVNDNLPEIVESFGTNCRKIFANEYIDDRNRLISSCHSKSGMEQWAENEVKLACQHVRPDRKEGEWDYDCACYEGALEAYKTLLNQGHTGFSIRLTKSILDRLIDAKPLTAIKDTDDVWLIPSSLDRLIDTNDDVLVYRCKRMWSLYKMVFTDGKVIYTDTKRYACTDIDDPNVHYRSVFINHMMDEMFPITMPYIPSDKSFLVYTESFCIDPKNGDGNTIGILYVVTPNGDKVEINRYFKEGADGMEEINQEEYLTRKTEAANAKEEN